MKRRLKRQDPTRAPSWDRQAAARGRVLEPLMDVLSGHGVSNGDSAARANQQPITAPRPRDFRGAVAARASDALAVTATFAARALRPGFPARDAALRAEVVDPDFLAVHDTGIVERLLALAHERIKTPAPFGHGALLVA